MSSSLRKPRFWLKVLSFLLGIPLLFFAVGAALVYQHRDELIQEALQHVNTRIDGLMTIDGVRISPLKNFPYISLDLRGVRFYETKNTDARPLYSFEDVYLGFDLKEVIQGRYDIRQINVEKGRMDIVHRCDGTYNIVAAKSMKDAPETDSTETNIHLDLKSLRLSEVDIAFLDELADRETDLNVDRLQARIKYVNKHFYIDLLSDLHLDVLEYGRPTFFANKKIHLDMEWDYDEDCQMLSVLPSQASLNEAHFKVEGGVDIPADMNISLKVRGDKPDFGVFAAFLPDDIAEGLKNYQNAGKIFFDGEINGQSLNGHIPAIDVKFGCENAYFLNKTVNKKVDQLRFTGHFTNGKERTLQSSELLLSNMYARPEEGVFEGRLAIKNFKAPIVKMDIHADLDLEFVGKFFQLRELDQVSGKILIDMRFDEIVDISFPGESLARLKTGIDSELSIRNLHFTLPEYGHTVSDINAHAVMQQGAITMDSLRFRVGASNIYLSGMLNDFPALFHRYDKPVRMELLARSERIDLPDLLKFDTALARQYDEVIENLSVQLAFETHARELFQFAYLPKGEFFIDDLYAKFKHYPHVLHDVHADIIVTENDLRLIDFSGELDRTDFHFTGLLNNYSKWFHEQPRGDSRFEFDLTSRYLSLHDLLSYKGENHVPPDYRDEVFERLKLHGSVDMHYDQGFKSLDLRLDELSGKMRIHPLKLEKFKGRAHFEDNHLLLEGFSGKMGKSDFVIDLSWFMGADPTQRKRRNYLTLKSNALDLDALLNYQPEAPPQNHEEAFNLFALTFPDLHIDAQINRLNYHRYWLENFKTRLRIQADHFVYVDTLAMRVAEGSLEMRGYFNGSNPKRIYFFSDLKADRLDIDKLLFKFDNFGQDMLINENLHGKISGNIRSTFRMHPDLTPILTDSEAHMELSVTDGTLLNFAPIMAMSNYFKDKNLRILRFDTLHNVFDLKNGELLVPEMTINSSIGFITLSGQQNLTDMSMNYFVRIPLRLVAQTAWRHWFGGKNKEETDPDQIDEIDTVGDIEKIRFLNIRISGSPEKYDIRPERNKREKRKKGK